MIGKTLGHYQITDKLGEGGMGVVYRARDTRLDRDVAIKMLPPDFASDTERLRRFEQEARAAGQLNHPNILVVYDVGAHEGAPYIVTELLEGESLRERLRSGAMPARKAVETAVQIAQGLWAAHEKGIIHRDLKPDNVFIAKDGHVKILDFGLAKLAAPRSRDESAGAATVTEVTQPGTVLGTVGYMSPEQVLGKPLDARSDLFSLGAVLYEMLSGTRPFQKSSAPETMTAILREDPPDLAGSGGSVPPGLDRIVRHCLEKEPTSRFQSARDIAFALESLSQPTTGGAAPLPIAGGKRRLAIGALALALLAGSYAGLFLWTKQAVKAPVPSFKRITLRRGTVDSARFTPDFQSVVYSAAWEGKPSEIFVQRLASADARSLGVLRAEVMGTAGGDLAIVREGTLARLPLEGGTQRDLLRDIDSATWDLSGSRLAIVRTVKDRKRLEYPVGKVLLETTGLDCILFPRLSPDGNRIAFSYRPSCDTDYSGDICVVDPSGRTRTLSKGWREAWNLAWSADGSEVWFSASAAGGSPELHAVTLSGKERLVARLPGRLVLQDIAPDGRVLLKFGQNRRRELRGRMAGDAAERDLSWLDGTFHPILAPDGSQMAFQEWSEGPESAYHWRMDSSTPTRLGDGGPCDVSPDWTTALVLAGSADKADLKLVPIGAGETVTLPRGLIHKYIWGFWHPDGKRIVIVGSDEEGQIRLFVQDVAGGLPRPLAGVDNFGLFSPDGNFVAARQKEGEPYALYPIDGGERRQIPFLRVDDEPLVFGEDGKSVFLAGPNRRQFPILVLRLDLETGKREPWLELAPPDRAGVLATFGARITPNGRFYVYGYMRELSDLYLVERLN